ncbi:hypothetical protein [Desulfofundulus thermosubterraneus]|uniref:Uncharacterized protein n=1 Tax=Desulfofundulus thermosubterraneus DSM 16057 TaxID=1121432 RepID=A0A1M6GYT9_9FIRM|nr:hypothetical protein [Desulfofundulus thermosubterraneus]SHJ15113.1 hypothetical protein SAMN02745219_01855 [Desulfofundulus thermosubterraneus DSM 16057]
MSRLEAGLSVNGNRQPEASDTRAAAMRTAATARNATQANRHGQKVRSGVELRELVTGMVLTSSESLFKKIRHS